MMHQARMTHEQSRWLRPDAARWVRPDAARFLKSGTRVEDVYPALALKYSPNQPRVPAGNTGGGRWTSGGGNGRSRIGIGATGSNGDIEAGDSATLDDSSIDGFDSEPSFGQNGDSAFDDIFAAHDSASVYDPAPSGSERITDPRIVSDADPETVKPGEQYAQAGRSRGGVNVRINGQTVEITPAQAAQLAVVRARAEDAVARVRVVDRDWKPTPSIYQSVDGMVRAYEADAIQAQVRMNELASQRLAPGPFAIESLPQPSGLSRAGETRAINEIGRQYGCTHCGTTSPSDNGGNFFKDHHPPTALNWSAAPQRLFPHCATCSAKQGWAVMNFRRGRQ